MKKGPSASKTTKNSTRQQLFSEDRPELYFHKAPGVGKTLPDLSGFKKEELVLMASSPMANSTRSAKNMNASDAKKNELYIAPLMKFF